MRAKSVTWNQNRSAGCQKVRLLLLRGEGDIITAMKRLRAISLGSVAAATLGRGSFTARILGSSSRACNLILDTADLVSAEGGEVVALVHRQAGNGPLNVVLAGDDIPFHRWDIHLPVVCRGDDLLLGNHWAISLAGARVWAPHPWPHFEHQRLSTSLAGLYRYLRAAAPRRGLLTLLFCTAENAEQTSSKQLAANSQTSASSAPSAVRKSALAVAFLERARLEIQGLMGALLKGELGAIALHAGNLAGLGPGLTPAGDDFLAGLMWGLRVWPCSLEESRLGLEDAIELMYEAARKRTTLLSAAFLGLAKEGLPDETWQDLLIVLAAGAGRQAELKRVAERVLNRGATSGADALAGFLCPYLCSLL